MNWTDNTPTKLNSETSTEPNRLVKSKKTCIFQEIAVTMRRSRKYVSQASNQDLTGIAPKKEKCEDPSSLVQGNK
jgi:hypothetical protein